MKKILVLALLCLPSAAYCQDQGKAAPAQPPAAGAEPGTEAALRRPDAQGILADLSAALRLSSKQQDRISSAIKKKASEFDKLMKEYGDDTEQEKKWRYKADDARYKMLKIDRDLPDTIRDFLDDEQRDAFDNLIAARKKAAEEAAAKAAEKTEEKAAPAPAPVRKRRLIRVKRLKRVLRKKPASEAERRAAERAAADRQPAAAPDQQAAPAAGQGAASPQSSDVPPDGADAGTYP